MLKQRTIEDFESESGFTLIEILVVIFIIAILMAIAAPGWLALMNRQRVNTVREDVLQTIRNAQNSARTTRSVQSVTLGNQNGVPSYSLDGGTTWQVMGSGQLKAGMVELTAGGNNQDTISFEYNGSLSDPSLVEDGGYKIVLETPDTGSKSCLVIQSILGATTQESGNGC